MCAKSFSEGIENSFALRCEASKNEDGFPGNGVDDITNFLIVEQQVNELSNFEVINRDHGFIFGSNDKVVLFGTFQLDIPHRNAMNGAARQVSALQIGSDEKSFIESGSLQIGFHQVCFRQIRSHKLCSIELRLAEIRPAQVLPPKIRFTEG